MGIKTVEEESTGDKIYGIGWGVTAFLVVADMLGGGIVALPIAFVKTGLSVGVLSMLIIAIFFAYTGCLLGQNWVILQERWPIYRKHCRKPYPEMALRSMGLKARAVTIAIIHINNFGTAVVYVLLSSRIIHNFVSYFGARVDYCYIILIVWLAILPSTYLKSPADFWMVTVVGICFAIAAVAIILIGTGIDLKSCMDEVHYPQFSLLQALLGFSTTIFAFSGHVVYPTIIHDMLKPTDFRKSVIMGFAMTFLLYIPLAVLAYVAYGDSMRETVIDSVQIPWMRYAGDFGIALHCLLSSVLNVNPINQELEEFFQLPHKCSPKRILLRTCLMIGVLAVSLTVPTFTPIMDVIGSTVIPLCCIFMPILFNMWLKAKTDDQTTKEYIQPTIREVIARTSNIRLLWNMVIMIIVLLGSAISFYMAVKEFATVTFRPPCYVHLLSSGEKTWTLADETFNCCGRYRNINLHGNSSYCRL